MSGVAAVVALVLGLGAAVWQAQVAAAERDRARTAQAEAEEAVTFLTNLFEDATPAEAAGDTLTVYDLVDRGRRRLSELSDQPTLQARMFDVVGEVHEKLSEYETADSLLRRSIQIQRTLPSPTPERLAEYLSERSSVKWKLGRYAAADSLARQAQRQMRRAGATNTIEYAEALALRANIALSRQHLDTADSLFQVTEERYRSLVTNAETDAEAETERTANLASVVHNRASIHYYRGNNDKAETLYRDALATYREAMGRTHPNVLTMHSALGLVLQRQGKLKAAATHLDTAITRGTRVLGPRHAQMAAYYNNLADVRRKQERYAPADSLYRLALSIDKATRGPQHPYVAGDWQSIGELNRAWGRPEQALEAFSQETALRRPKGPSVSLARALCNQGTVLTDLGRYAAAEDRLREARAVHARLDEHSSSLAADLRTAFATLYADQGRSQEAQRWRERAEHPDSLYSSGVSLGKNESREF
jgi:serine/threonine-protein kinase